MTIDVSKIRPIGHWVFLKLEQPELVDGFKKSAGGLLLSKMSNLDKIGYCWATVISKGQGKVNEKTGELIPSDAQVGETVLVRWYLTEVNQIPFDKEHCFVHQDDLLLVREGDYARVEIA